VIKSSAARGHVVEVDKVADESSLVL